jgi:signal transduction histidine kinase/CheY-like chemotaxis protein
VTELLAFLQNATAVAFGLLGIATAITWLRRREPALGFLALAIILLCLVDVIGLLPEFGFSPPLLSELVIVMFVASGYALLRYRGSLIAIPRGWHMAVVVGMVAGAVVLVAGETLNATKAVPVAVITIAGLFLIVLWALMVIEPVVRFWLVSNRIPAVQRWRLRSLSIGFAGIILAFALVLAASAFTKSPVVTVIGQLLILGIVPLLYASFSPPSWLRREWRAPEEEGLRRFMERLLLSDHREDLAPPALEWVLRLTGGAGAVVVDAEGKTLAASGVPLDPDAKVIVIPIKLLGGEGRLTLIAGPFTPGFGSDEVSRVQQFMSAVATALDRQRLIQSLKNTNARLDKANKYKSIFLANMSHELRTPLNAIIGFSELLIDARDGQFDAATRNRFLSQIHSSGKHLLALINDILDLSKIEAGQMELRLEMVSVRDVIEDVEHTVEPLAAQKKIEITWEPGPPKRAVVDAGKLKQMVLNLVSNAIKFTPDGGHVGVAVKWHDNVFDVAITDSGIGIAAEDQSRIFEEFQQVDSGAGRAQQGTGLGLTLTRRFAHLHNGEVSVTSGVGKGSTFTLTLPSRSGEALAAEPEAGVILHMPQPTGPLVLIVEDNLSAAELVAHSLARGGFQTTVATSGRDAIAKAKELQPLAITLDVMLPELDGWEVLARLKRDPATADIPVVIVSVIDNPELGIALGALDYFVKPVEATALVRCVSRYNFRRNGHDECRVLVVDDELANRDLLREILEPAGFDVVLAAGGQEAIDLAAETPPDLVLLDLMMPDVNGFDVVERLRDRTATRATPIIVLTAKELTDDDKAQLSGRVSRILARRSTGAADLLSQVQEVLEHRGVPA